MIACLLGNVPLLIIQDDGKKVLRNNASVEGALGLTFLKMFKYLDENINEWKNSSAL